MRGEYIGLVVAHEARLGVGFDVALRWRFFVVAATRSSGIHTMRSTSMALAFWAHAVLDVAHRPGCCFPTEWRRAGNSIGSAGFDVYIGALCYLPILRRS